MITHALLQEKGSGRLGHEETLLAKEFARRSIPFSLFTPKRVQRRELPLSPQTFVAGDMDVMHGVLRQMKVEPPPPDDCPASLEPWLHRRIWRSTLGKVQRDIMDGTQVSVFVKPSVRRKSFTGHVFDGFNDFGLIGNVSRRQEVWCSEVVGWLSEYRIYVTGSNIAAIDRYAGDAVHPLNMAEVEEALAAYRGSGDAPVAYGIDFGVLSTGLTALVEANDGYSLGAYQIPAQPYTDLLLARWEELMSRVLP